MNADTDMKDFKRAMAITAETLRGNLSDTTMLAYFEALQEFALVDVLDSLLAARKTMAFFPSPVQLAAMIVPKDEALIQSAWLECLELTIRDPWNTTILICDPILNAVVRSFGGPMGIFRQGEDFAKFNHKRFCETYRSHLDMQRNFGLARPSKLIETGDHPHARKRVLNCTYAPASLRAITIDASDVELISTVAQQKRITQGEQNENPPKPI